MFGLVRLAGAVVHLQLWIGLHGEATIGLLEANEQHDDVSRLPA
jgi:hypothetical protein